MTSKEIKKISINAEYFPISEFYEAPVGELRAVAFFLKEIAIQLAVMNEARSGQGIQLARDKEMQ